MRFGISAGNIAPQGSSIDDCLETAERADVLEFDSVWVQDHVTLPARGAARYAYLEEGERGGIGDAEHFEPLVVLNAFAAITHRARVGTMVLAMPFRHPAVTAKMLAVADLVSDGRLTVGVGTGWVREEFAALGLEEQVASQGAVTDEYIRAVKELWTNTGPSNFAGEFMSFGDVGVFPKPAQRPHPPIVVAGASERAMIRASRLGNGYVLTAVTPEGARARVERLRAICRRDRRDPGEVEVFLFAPVDLHVQAVSERERRPLSGMVEQIAGDLRAYARAGVEHVVAVPLADGRAVHGERRIEWLETVANELLPAFGQTSAR